MRLSLALAPRSLLFKAAIFNVQREASGVDDVDREAVGRVTAGAASARPTSGASSLCAEIEVDLAQRVRESGEW